jgi:VIT1/CCC1 family predicted Fe2+/Mn2+ transporter
MASFTIRADDEGEHKELMAIYIARGLDAPVAKQVADQLMDHDALGAHARDELGISKTLRARPIQAALTSVTRNADKEGASSCFPALPEPIKGISLSSRAGLF